MADSLFRSKDGKLVLLVRYHLLITKAKLTRFDTGNNGKHLKLHSDGIKAFVRCDGGGEGVDLAIRTDNSGRICLCISGQGSDRNGTHFLSSMESDSGGFDSLDVASNVNDDCWLRFENLSGN